MKAFLLISRKKGCHFIKTAIKALIGQIDVVEIPLLAIIATAFDDINVVHFARNGGK